MDKAEKEVVVIFLGLEVIVLIQLFVHETQPEEIGEEATILADDTVGLLFLSKGNFYHSGRHEDFSLE